MSKKKIKQNPAIKKDQKKDYVEFKNPSESVVGKVILGILFFGFVASIIIGAIIVTIQAFK